MVGGFVVIAFAILAASVVILGGGQLFKKTLEYVLYFDGSVKGLRIGSPVLFRGVQVGMVKNIVVRAYMKDLITYVPVFITINPERFELIWGKEDKRTSPGQRIERVIKRRRV